MDDNDRHKHSDENPAVLTGVEARQGSPRQMSMRVLLIGTLLAVVAGLVVAGVFYLPPDRAPAVPAAPPQTQPR
ncbi:MAG: hypothetical protein AB7O57_16905 [Hyphomicrobiaceae bacterium]